MKRFLWERDLWSGEMSTPKAGPTGRRCSILLSTAVLRIQYVPFDDSYRHQNIDRAPLAPRLPRIDISLQSYRSSPTVEEQKLRLLTSIIKIVYTLVDSRFHTPHRRGLFWTEQYRMIPPIRVIPHEPDASLPSSPPPLPPPSPIPLQHPPPLTASSQSTSFHLQPPQNPTPPKNHHPTPHPTNPTKLFSA